MKIRSVLELTEALAEESAWRKKELSSIRMLIVSQKRLHEKAALRRAAVPMLYAHWEGFAKQAATCYLHLVVRQRQRLCDLTTNFVAIVARGQIRQAAGSKRVLSHMPVVEFLLGGLKEEARFSVDAVIDTESNLNSTVLRDLFATIGLVYGSEWSARELLVDGSLLKARNDVAHGVRREIDPDTYEQLHELVLDLVDDLRTAIENHAVSRAYLRTGGGSG